MNYLKKNRRLFYSNIWVFRKSLKTLAFFVSKKISTTSILIVLTFAMTSAQTVDKQVFAVAGNSINNATYKLIFTIGEPIIGTIQNNITINQGFLAAASSSTTLSVDEQLLSTAIKVYPNPVTENLSIDLTNITGKAKLTIYTMTGQLVGTSTFNQGHNSLNIEHLQNGVYLVNLQFTDYNTVKSFKIIKN